MILGFTGTSSAPLAPRQLKALRRLLAGSLPYALNVAALHLGDCVHADAEAHEAAEALGVRTVGHPPEISVKRAFLRYDEERAPKGYLARNWDIVVEGVDGLIACPKDFTETRRSGTWATVRAARKLGRRIWIILPDGQIKHEAAR